MKNINKLKLGTKCKVKYLGDWHNATVVRPKNVNENMLSIEDEGIVFASDVDFVEPDHRPPNPPGKK